LLAAAARANLLALGALVVAAAAARVVTQTALEAHQIQAAAAAARDATIQLAEEAAAQVAAALSESATSERQSVLLLARLTLHHKRVATPSIPSLNPETW
jgi:siroheme synthase